MALNNQVLLAILIYDITSRQTNFEGEIASYWFETENLNFPVKN
jgi:hypothetical protein